MLWWHWRQSESLKSIHSHSHTLIWSDRAAFWIYKRFTGHNERLPADCNLSPALGESGTRVLQPCAVHMWRRDVGVRSGARELITQRSQRLRPCFWAESMLLRELLKMSVIWCKKRHRPRVPISIRSPSEDQRCVKATGPPSQNNARWACWPASCQSVSQWITVICSLTEVKKNERAVQDVWEDFYSAFWCGTAGLL